MPKSASVVCEEFLQAWLSISGSIKNERLVKSITFSELFTLGIIYRNPSTVNAKMIATETGMLKSQVNKVITELVNKSFIKVSHSEKDKRRINISITKKGISFYEKQHEKVLTIVREIYDKIGNEKISKFVVTANQITSVFKELGYAAENDHTVSKDVTKSSKKDNTSKTSVNKKTTAKKSVAEKASTKPEAKKVADTSKTKQSKQASKTTVKSKPVAKKATTKKAASVKKTVAKPVVKTKVAVKKKTAKLK